MLIPSTVKRLRKERGLTLQGLADKAGLSKSYIWEIENGSAPSPSLTTGFAIADSLGVTIYALVGRDEIR